MASGRSRIEGNSPRILVVSYTGLTRLVQSVSSEYQGRAEIRVVNMVFDEAVAVAREAMADNSADIIVSAGANADLLRSQLQVPVVTIRATGYDVLQALLKARRLSEHVGVVTFAEPIPELDAVKDVLRLTLSQRTYRTIDEARDCFRSLAAEGYSVIVGSSLVCDLAEASGLQSILTYSPSSVRAALDNAIELHRVARLEAERYAPMRAALEHLHEAVLAVDIEQRVMAINPAMERILGISREVALGSPLTALDLDLDLASILTTGERELGLATRLRGVECVADRTPIFDGHHIVGAMLTLHDAHAIQRADSNLRTQRRQHSLTARYRFNDILSQSSQLRFLRTTAERYAATSSTILITGESGTGKELFAQAIHNASSRRDAPFVAVNCASFPESLLESELFGYEEGAFTGSRKGGKIGLFEAAHRGTIFLDEIGDMALPLQTRLLRVLQEREVLRLGSTQPIPVDVRVIAATHHDLWLRIENGLFRADLYYRLNILRLHLPPLRERREDIEVLAINLLSTALRRHGVKTPASKILEPILPLLINYHWPGNVRELENVIERLAVCSSASRSNQKLTQQDLSVEFPELFNKSPVISKHPAVARSHPADRVIQALAEAGGRHQLAAQRLGVSRTTLWRWLKAAERERTSAGANR